MIPLATLRRTLQPEARTPQDPPAAMTPAARPAGRTTLNRFERSRIDKAVRKAFSSLPAALVRQMATIPPATPEVALRARTTVAELERDRDTAAVMIALHAVLEGVIDTRNRFWTRGAREHMSGAIDAYARTAILRELGLHEASDAEKMKTAAAAVAQKGTGRYVIGVSQREICVLHRLTEHVMRACYAAAPGPLTEQSQAAYNNMSKEEAKLVYENIDPAMVNAFCAMFTAYDERVRNQSLDGVDHRVLGEIEASMRPDDEGALPVDDWRDHQIAAVSQALDEACARLPEHLRAAARHRYIQQFLRPFDMPGSRRAELAGSVGDGRRSLEYPGKQNSASRGSPVRAAGRCGHRRIGRYGVARITRCHRRSRRTPHPGGRSSGHA